MHYTKPFFCWHETLHLFRMKKCRQDGSQLFESAIEELAHRIFIKYERPGNVRRILEGTGRKGLLIVVIGENDDLDVFSDKIFQFVMGNNEVFGTDMLFETDSSLHGRTPYRYTGGVVYKITKIHCVVESLF